MAFPTTITDNIYEAVARLSTTLTADVTDSDLSFPVASTAGFPAAGYAVVDNETVYYSALGVNSLTIGQRAVAGTAAAHLSEAQVKYAVVAQNWNNMRTAHLAVENKMGISGSTYTTTLDYMVHNLPTQGTTGQVSNLNAQYLGGKTSSQYLWAGSTATDASKLTNINGATVVENDMEFSAYDFKLNNDNPATLVALTGSSANPGMAILEFGNTDCADLPPFKMPRSYNGGTVTLSMLYCSSTASSVFDIGIRNGIAGNNNYYPWTALGTAIYLGNITCSANSSTLGFTSKDIAGVSLGLTTNKANHIRVLGGTTCTVQLVSMGLRWNKG
jgi:hypothetical protein